MKHFLTLLLLGLLGFAQAQVRISYSNYQLALDEDFDYPSLQALNQKWYLKGDFDFLQNSSAIFSADQVQLLPQGGIQLTATPLARSLATREPAGKNIFFRSGMLSLPLTEPYGIYEVIAHIPQGAAHMDDIRPTVKLVGDNFEIAIVEALENSKNYLRQYVATPQSSFATQQCGHRWGFENIPPLWAENDMVFQTVWTPQEVSFFIQGYEVATVPVQLPQTKNLALVLALPTSEAATEESRFAIKNVRIYRHIDGKPYEYTRRHSWEFHEVTPAGGLQVMDGKHCIAPNQNQPDEVFFTAADGMLYLATQTGNQWKLNKIGISSPDGNLTFVKALNSVVFRNDRGELAGYLRKNGRFEYFTKANIRPLAMTDAPDGQVIVAEQNSIIALKINDLSFEVERMIAGVQPAGDIAADETGRIFYKDRQNHLRALRPYGLTFEQLPLPQVTLSAAPGAIDFSQYSFGKGIVFRDAADRFNTLRFVGNDFQIKRLDGVDDRTAQRDAHIASPLAAATQNNVFYLGPDRRLQVVASDLLSRNKIHWWVDDHWLTTKYRSADPATSSLAFGTGERLFYKGDAGNLVYFGWEFSRQSYQCKILRNEGQQPLDLQVLTVYPNPSSDFIRFKLSAKCDDCDYRYQIMTLDGRIVSSGRAATGENSLDIGRLPAGNYHLTVTGEGEILSAQFTKG